MTKERHAFEPRDVVAAARAYGVVGDFLLGGFFDAEDVAALAAVAEDRDALAARFPCCEVDVLDVGGRRRVLQVYRRGDGVVDVLLHGGLQFDAVQVGDVVALDDPREALLDVLVREIVRQLVIVEQIADGVGVDAEGAASFLHLVRRALVADLIERLAAAAMERSVPFLRPYSLISA